MNMKITKQVIAGLSLLAMAVPASAQTADMENLAAEKTVSILGEKPKVWYYYENGVQTGQTETFDTEDLVKLTQVPTNTDNVFLYPQKDNLSGIAANQAIGVQGFYVDLGSSQAVGSVVTTWEGAAAKAYQIFLTDDTPTLDILTTTPVVSASGLGQYTENTAILPDNSKGRYLVFQVLDATNWGWGVKIRSISAYAPTDDVLTTFKVTPAIIPLNEATQVTLTMLNQLGVAMPIAEVDVEVSSNAIYSNEGVESDGTITIKSGDTATFTAKHGDVTLTQTIYVAQAPVAPDASSIKTPIFTNTVTDDNSTAEFTVNYNAQAVNLGEITYENGEVAQLFSEAGCIFFSNSVTTGAWNGNINPKEKGYGYLCLDVFPSISTTASIEFEKTEGLDGAHTFNYDIIAGQWNSISVDISEATLLNNMSIRFDQNNKPDILLANIYFAPDEYKAKNGYYLVGTMTADFDGGYKPNPSYMFSPATVDGTVSTTEYTLPVGSVSAQDKFYIAMVKGDEITYYSNSSATGMKPSTDNGATNEVLLEADNTTDMTLIDSYVNVTFTLVLDAQDSTPYTLYYNGEESGSDWAISPGDDKTNQSGTATGKSIEIITLNDTAIAFIYVPTTDNKYPDGTVLYYEVNVTSTDDTPQQTAATRKAATVRNGNFSLNLDNNTSGTIDVYSSADASTAIANFDYTVSRSTPTSVEAIGGEEAENVDVFTLQGICVKRNVNKAEATSDLPAGIYIVAGKKVVKK